MIIKGNKFCPRCNKEKNISEFHNNKGKPDGKSSWCKECNLNQAQQKATLVATTKGKDKMKKGTVLKDKKEIKLTDEQKTIIDRINSNRLENPTSRLTSRDKKDLYQILSLMKENNYRNLDIRKIITISPASISKILSKKSYKYSSEVKSSPEVSLQKHSIRRVEVLTAKKDPVMSLFSVDLENKALIFASRSEMFTFMNRIAGDE